MHTLIGRYLKSIWFIISNLHFYILNNIIYFFIYFFIHIYFKKLHTIFLKLFLKNTQNFFLSRAKIKKIYVLYLVDK